MQVWMERRQGWHFKEEFKQHAFFENCSKSRFGIFDAEVGSTASR